MKKFIGLLSIVFSIVALTGCTGASQTNVSKIDISTVGARKAEITKMYNEYKAIGTQGTNDAKLTAVDKYFSFTSATDADKIVFFDNLPPTMSWEEASDSGSKLVYLDISDSYPATINFDYKLIGAYLFEQFDAEENKALDYRTFFTSEKDGHIYFKGDIKAYEHLQTKIDVLNADTPEGGDTVSKQAALYEQIIE